MAVKMDLLVSLQDVELPFSGGRRSIHCCSHKCHTEYSDS